MAADISPHRSPTRKGVNPRAFFPFAPEGNRLRKTHAPTAFLPAARPAGRPPFAPGGGIPPNFVILFADDLGINDLGCFGRQDQRTPNLDKLAAEGVRFTQAYTAASVCSASRAALLTGQSPARLKITTFLTGRSDRASHRLLSAPINLHLPAGVPTLAELLKSKGYVSTAIGKWHLGGKGHQPTDHGFDEYFAGKPNPGAESPQGVKG